MTTHYVSRLAYSFGGPRSGTGCGLDHKREGSKIKISHDRKAVTCRRCRRSRMFLLDKPGRIQVTLHFKSKTLRLI